MSDCLKLNISLTTYFDLLNIVHYRLPALGGVGASSAAAGVTVVSGHDDDALLSTSFDTVTSFDAQACGLPAEPLISTSSDLHVNKRAQTI